MQKIPAAQILSWSYSRYKTYSLCAFKAKALYIDKFKEPDSPAMARGSEIHLKAEHFVMGATRTVPKELALVAEPLKALKKLRPETELELAYDRNWKKVAWMSPTAWCRIKIDVLAIIMKDCTARVIDYKTGKSANTPAVEGIEQLELYALATFLEHPEVKSVSTELWYVDEAPREVASGPYGVNPFKATFTPADLPKLKKTWEARTKKMLADKSFKATPNSKCCWCSFSRKKGGPCKF